MRRGCGCSSIWLGVFLIIFMGVGALTAWWGWRVLQNASVSRNWPSVPGQITQASIRTDTDEDGTTYFAEIGYAYVVNDRRYSADSVNFGQYGSSNRGHAEEIVTRYPPGRPVLVYYDPADPGTAVLEPGITWSSYMVLGIGLSFVLISMVIGGFSIFKRIRL